MCYNTYNRYGGVTSTFVPPQQNNESRGDFNNP